MRVLALLILLVALPADAKKPKKEKAPAPAPTALVPLATGQQVQLPCNYEPGATWRFVMEKTTVDTRPGQPEDRMVSREEFTIRVTGWDGKVVTAAWEGTKVELVDPPNDPVGQQLLEELMKLDFPEPTLLEYSHEAGRINVTNVDVLVRQAATAIDTARPFLEEIATRMPEEERAKFVDGVIAFATNPVVITKSTIEGGQPLFAYSCLDVVSGTYEYTSQLPNALGPPLPARGTIVLGDPEPDRVRWVDALLLDPVGAKELLDGMARVMGIDLPPDPGIEDLQLDVSMRYDIAISPADGWPIGWTAEKRSGAAGALKVERTVVTRLQ